MGASNKYFVFFAGPFLHDLHSCVAPLSYERASVGPLCEWRPPVNASLSLLSVQSCVQSGSSETATTWCGVVSHSHSGTALRTVQKGKLGAFLAGGRPLHGRPLHCRLCSRQRCCRSR